MCGREESGLDGAEGELLSLLGLVVLIVKRADSLENVLVGSPIIVISDRFREIRNFPKYCERPRNKYSLVITSLRGSLGDQLVKLSLVLLIDIPLLHPGLELGQVLLKLLKHAVVDGELDDGQEDVVPGLVVGLGHVEDVGEGTKGETGAVLGRRGDGLGEVVADSRQEHVGVLGLQDEVDEQVVGGAELALGDRVEGGGGDDDLLKDLILLVLLDEGLDLGADVDVVSHLLGQLVERAVHEDKLGLEVGVHRGGRACLLCLVLSE